jgi:hypothetical protein
VAPIEQASSGQGGEDKYDSMGVFNGHRQGGLSMNPHKAGLFTLLWALLLTSISLAPGWAVTTSFWEVRYREQFDKGTPEDVSIHSDGKVTLSPKLDLVADTGEPFVWCLAEDSRGNLYAGTGNNGKIFRVSRDGQLTLWHDAEELEILSLAVDGDDYLYAGTSPGGQIIRVSPKGQASLFFSTEEDHVWSLVFAEDGNLFCGTGDEGKIYKVPPDGRGQLLYDTKETNITSLAWWEGHLYAGGDGNGLIYKIDSRDQGRMLFDAAEQEIRNLVFGPEGQLYAAATSGEKPGRRPPKPEKAPPPETESGEMLETIEVFAGEVGKPELGGPSAIYEIDGLGSGIVLWTAPEMAMVFSMALGPRGDLIVGSGDEGRIYSVDTDGSWSMLVDGQESQALALMSARNGDVLVGTGNLGKVFRLLSDYVKEGTLESEVHDATFVARWGRIYWDADRLGGTRLSLQTRSGNSQDPDETWSPWSEPSEKAEGEMISSPPARFIQWRANLSTSDGEITPVLERVWLAYVQRNLAPKIHGIYVHPAGGEGVGGSNLSRRESKSSSFADQGEPSSGDLFRGSDQVGPGLRRVSWQAFDPNGDRLRYDLYFRGEEEQEWKLLKEDLTNASYTWDSQSFPDGTYLLRVEARDSPDNPEGQALSDEKISDPFVVDNTPPKVLQVKGRAVEGSRYQVVGRAADELSPIKELWYSVDAGDWKALPVSDGVSDSPEEKFSFATEPLSPGEHTIVIKAVDMASNVGAGKTIVRGRK